VFIAVYCRLIGLQFLISISPSWPDQGVRSNQTKRWFAPWTLS